VDCGCTAADVFFSAILGGLVGSGFLMGVVVGLTGGPSAWRLR
jgi:hypothetical protein